MRALMCQVFIPDLLIPISKFLGDDDIAIRFVCKAAHSNLRSEVSRVTLCVLDDDQHVCNQNQIVKKVPYLTSVSNLRWALDALKIPLNRNTFEAAVAIGNLEVVIYISDRAKERDFSWCQIICKHAAQYGHLDVLHWARAQDPPCPWDANVCMYAARNGHLGVLQWLRAQDPPCPWGEDVCRRAAQNGHLDVLHWARAQDPPCPWFY